MAEIEEPLRACLIRRVVDDEDARLIDDQTPVFAKHEADVRGEALRRISAGGNGDWRILLVLVGGGRCLRGGRCRRGGGVGRRRRVGRSVRVVVIAAGDSRH